MTRTRKILNCLVAVILVLGLSIPATLAFADTGTSTANSVAETLVNGADISVIDSGHIELIDSEVDATGEVQEIETHYVTLNPGDTPSFESDMVIFNDGHVMPGDVKTSQVEISNQSGSTVDFYLSISNDDIEALDFISQCDIAITLSGSGEQLYSGSFADIAGADALNIGRFETGDAVTLEITLNVPVTLDNDYALTSDGFTLTIGAQEVEQPVDESSPFASSPFGSDYDKTGGTWAILGLVIAACAGCAVLVARKLKKGGNNV